MGELEAVFAKNSRAKIASVSLILKIQPYRVVSVLKSIAATVSPCCQSAVTLHKVATLRRLSECCQSTLKNMAMKVTAKLLKRFIKIVAPHGLGVEADGRLVDPFEQYFAQKIIAYLKVIERIKQWGCVCQSLAIELELEELIAKLNRLLPARFIRRRLTPTRLRISKPRIEALQSLGARAPPSVAIFVPIPKTEMGSCARSDLPADSAY